MKNQIVEFIRTKDFKYIKQIGQGGTGKTVLLKDEIIDEDFVCKKYLPYYEEHKDLFYKNFVEEIKILHKLYHRNVVRVFNYYLYPEKKTGYILMEYILGENIEVFIQENPHLINDIFLQTVNGFRYLEENGILHRDIRPDNILINENGEVKIIDFGSCYSKGIAEIATPLDDHGILGTASYSAPEVVITGKSTVQSEVFSLAVLAYEMLTGKEPFSGKLSKCRTVKAYLKTKYIPCFDINPLVPIWIDCAIKKGVRFKADRRHEDVLEFLHELQNPNPKYKSNHNAVLMDKNPVLFWQLFSAFWFLAFFISLIF